MAKAPVKPAAAPVKAATAPKAAPIAKTPAKPVAKVAPPAKPEPVLVPKYEAGTLAVFKGYAAGSTPGIFTADQVVHVYRVDTIAIETPAKAEGGKPSVKKSLVYICIKPEDVDATKEDPELAVVEAEQFTAAELKTYKAPVEEVHVETPVVGDMKTILKNNDLTAAGVKLLEDANKNFFYLGGVLAKIFNDKLYVDMGFPIYGEDGTTKVEYLDPEDDTRKIGAFAAYCLANFGFAERKAVYYKDIYMSLSVIPGLDLKKLGTIGWSKAATISQFVTAENVDELMVKAEETPVVELRKYVVEHYETVSGKSSTRDNANKKVNFVFKLFADQADGVNLVLAEARKQLQPSDDAALFEHIVMTFGQNHLGDAAKKGKLAAAITKATAPEPVPAPAPAAKVAPKAPAKAPVKPAKAA